MGISKERISLFEDYFQWLQLERNCRESTARTHLQALLTFRNFSKDPLITKDRFQDFLNKERLLGRKASYLNHFVQSIRVYNYFLQEKGKPFDPEIATIKYLKEDPTFKATMSDQEIEQFLSYTPKQTRGFSPRNYRTWTLFFSILAYTGMRPTEVAHLTIDDVDFGKGVFIVRSEVSKTHTMRYIPMPQNLVEELKYRIENIEHNLFASFRGGTGNNNHGVFDSVDWGYNFRTRLNYLGIKRKNLTVYSLRHSFITRLLSEDVNIFKVQKIVGHTRLDTTAAYTHLTFKDSQRAMMKDPLQISKNPRLVLHAVKDFIRGLSLDNNPNFTFELDETENTIAFKLVVAS